jgi:RNA-directed DNA polymerase
MSTAATPVYEWNDLDWKAIERRVFKLQTRIYRAARRGNVKTVQRLQRLLMVSWSARCLAVRRVSQDNRGKKTAGVDGVKNLPPDRRLQLATLLRLTSTAHPTRRVWIPKPGHPTERRGLGIPTLFDRARQALAKLLLEPEWEARFEPHSYGFRPGRSAHDAIEAIFLHISRKPKYVLDADIAKCFDRIDQSALLNKLHTFPRLRRAIKAWLKAGMMDGLELTPTEQGTPQGGVASPLLASIALHGLETAIRDAFPRTHRVNGKTIDPWQPVVIRYADDLVVLHEDEGVIRRVQQIMADWLAGMGLELKPSKTRITHTLHPYEGQVGFDFLGFHIQQVPVGKTHTGRNGHGIPLGFKTIITPSKEAQQRHQQALGTLIRHAWSLTQEDLIERLNRSICGWVNYYATVASKQTFAKMHALLFAKLLHWTKRRHPRKPIDWITKKYWRRERGSWTFGVKHGPTLYVHDRKPIRRHIKVRDDKSVYDGDWVYWASRLGRHPDLPHEVALLLKRQAGKCAWCGLYFRADDVKERDHLVPTSDGGDEHPRNRQLLHGHCHDQKTAQDGSYAASGTRDKGH